MKGEKVIKYHYLAKNTAFVEQEIVDGTSPLDGRDIAAIVSSVVELAKYTPPAQLRAHISGLLIPLLRNLQAQGADTTLAELEARVLDLERAGTI